MQYDSDNQATRAYAPSPAPEQTQAYTPGYEDDQPRYYVPGSGSWVTDEAPAEEYAGEYDDLMYDEEYDNARRQGRFRVVAGLADFFGVILGTIVILVMITLLISLVTWLRTDIAQSFALVMK
ncbi:MAG: hypothetical protein Q4C54_03380 [Clostridia bacterium]|nr:hypothetical protein [Clostridia bacterium]